MDIPYTIYILITFNLVSFLSYGLDKGLARLGWRRIPERILLISMVLGVVGGLAGMKVFRHKTSKRAFQLKALLPVLLGALLLGFEIYLLI